MNELRDEREKEANMLLQPEPAGISLFRLM